MSQMLIQRTYPMYAGDFAVAGEASASIKKKLKQLGINSTVLRRVAVAAYEVELNLVIHSMGGTLTLEVTPEKVRLLSKDVGPGIPDVGQAMREGYSTANEEARSLGFGAGMGLPNMRRNATTFEIQSWVGIGTSIDMSFSLTE